MTDPRKIYTAVTHVMLAAEGTQQPHRSKQRHCSQQQKVQSNLEKIKLSWMNKEQLEHLEGGVWRAVEAR